MLYGWISRWLVAAVLAAAAALGGLALLGLLVTSLPPAVLFAGVYAAIAVAAICSSFIVVVGLVVSAKCAPLTPVAEISILGKRLVGFAKFSLAVATLFGTAAAGWVVARTLDSGGLEAHALSVLWEIVGAFVVGAAIVYWLWLSVDLMRLRRTHRVAAVAAWVKRTALPDFEQGLLRRVACAAIGDRLGIVGAFYLAPLLVAVLGVALTQYT